MIKPTLEQIKLVMKAKGYVYFNGPKAYDLNIIGIRTASRNSNLFDDFLTVSGKDEKGKEFLKIFDCTTDPGVFYLKNPIAGTNGAAILIPGQYRNVFKFGLHQGYPALEQIGTMCYVRDNDRDDVLDIEELMLDKKNFIYGIIKSNIHRANKKMKSIQVDKWSAACQVVADPNDFDNELLPLVKKSIVNYSNSFSYTLLEEKDFKNPLV